MSFISSIPVIGSLVETIAERLGPDKSNVLKAQSRINEAEVAGAPRSRLRLWRSFLGWILATVLAWEIVARPVILTYWPYTTLPPSMINEIKALLLAMLGLGI